MSVSSNFEEIWQAWLQLKLRWQGTKQLWLDHVQREFEREFWNPVDNFMPKFREHSEKLDKVIKDAKRNVN